jgi:hypothetical protein
VLGHAQVGVLYVRPMIRVLSDFVCSRVRIHADTLKTDARGKYLRRAAFAYQVWVWLSGLNALISFALAAYVSLSALDRLRKIGYAALFLIFAAGFAVLSLCFFSASRFARYESTKV